MRIEGVKQVYVIYGKAGGQPEVRWSRYEDCVTHVRVSHAPRFMVDLETNRTSSFEHLKIDYDHFRVLDDAKKMEYIREYSRNRMQAGERLWWLEEQHTLSMQVRLYMRLPQQEKRMMRAEAALLCPQIC